MTIDETPPLKIKARLPKGFIDKRADQLAQIETISRKITSIYRLYGFEALETPFFEYSDALGKFLPDQDRPNAGVFSLRDDDEEWLSLRYDLTAPLARFVAENFANLTKPYRSYRMGPVFRNEKPGPGRFRQFLQFDADIIGAFNPLCDAEIAMMAIDCLKNLGFGAGEVLLKVNNRKILDAILQAIGLDNSPSSAQQAEQRLTVLRALDKWDKFGDSGVEQLLGQGRLDESGDFTKGAGLESAAIAQLLDFLNASKGDNQLTLSALSAIVQDNAIGRQGVAELEQIFAICQKLDYAPYFKIDPSIIRGLDYYTGLVFEAQLLHKITNQEGQEVVFGSVGGGGRYDDLIARFGCESLPATGFSLGVSRLLTAMENLSKLPSAKKFGPVTILVLERDGPAMVEYHNMAKELREAGIACDIYMGQAGIKAQMKYADRRHSPCVIIYGQREREEGQIQIKDLIKGAQMAKEISSNEVWRSERPAQITIPRAELVAQVKALLARY